MVFKKSIRQVFFLMIAFGLVCVQCLFVQKKMNVKNTEKAVRNISSASCSPSQNGAVVIMYHRFDGLYSDTSVTKEQLKQHIQFFLSKGFNIAPLKDVVKAVKSGRSLPVKTLAITIDDAYKSAYEQAHPLFLKHRIPYTVFVNTEGIDRGLKDYMTWDQLRSISQSKLASLEAHGHAHAYMIRKLNATQREKDVKTSVTRLYQETGYLPKYFAYPYGETHKQFMRELKNYNWNIDGRAFRFEAAFTTQSGPTGCSSNLFALPRFAFNMRYGKINNLFLAKMNSRHFPVQKFLPDDLAFCSRERQKSFFLTGYPGISLSGLNCFSTNGGSTVKIKNQNQAEIILNSSFTHSNQSLRQRINCTLPAGKGQFFWMGKEFAILDC